MMELAPAGARRQARDTIYWRSIVGCGVEGTVRTQRDVGWGLDCYIVSDMTARHDDWGAKIGKLPRDGEADW